MDNNILVLSSGRRVELIQRFKNAAKEISEFSKVIAVDISKTAPALYFADEYYIVPRITDNNYIESIIDICKKRDISLIVPTIDTELLKLSENRKRIEKECNAKILLSRDAVIKICRNKHNTQKFLENNGFKVPVCLSDEDIKGKKYKFPLFIKPEDGSSSINAFKINNEEELNFFRNYINKPIIQEFISGTEYSVDVFCDFDSNPITIVPRKRVAIRGGEILKGQVEKNRIIIDDVKRMVEILQPIGHITVQCMITERGVEYIEINPRFGGGAPMSIDAGADSCKNLFRLLKGEKLKYNEDYRDNIFFSRFDSSIEISNYD